MAYTVDEAALLLGLGRTTAFRLVASGQLKSFTIGRARRVPAQAISDFVAAALDKATA